MSSRSWPARGAVGRPRQRFAHFHFPFSQPFSSRRSRLGSTLVSFQPRLNFPPPPPPLLLRCAESSRQCAQKSLPRRLLRACGLPLCSASREEGRRGGCRLAGAQKKTAFCPMRRCHQRARYQRVPMQKRRRGEGGRSVVA